MDQVLDEDKDIDFIWHLGDISYADGKQVRRGLPLPLSASQASRHAWRWRYALYAQARLDAWRWYAWRWPYAEYALLPLLLLSL